MWGEEEESDGEDSEEESDDPNLETHHKIRSVENETEVGVRRTVAPLLQLVYDSENARRAQKREMGTRKRDIVRYILWEIGGSFGWVPEAPSVEEVRATVNQVGYQLKTETSPSSPWSGSKMSSKQTIWFQVFIKQRSCRCSAAPKVVVAVRGTLIDSWMDLRSDLRVLSETLHEDPRYDTLLDVVTKEVNEHGHQNVAIAGHSLGAAFALLVGQKMVHNGKPVECYLFNPPFPSVGGFNSKFLRGLESAIKMGLTGGHNLAAGIIAIGHDNVDMRESLAHSKNQFWNLSNWKPHIYINKDDLISNGYLNFFRDQSRNDAAFDWRSLRTWRATLRRIVEHLTIIALLFDPTSPRHLIPSAIITSNSSSISRLRKKSGCKIMSKLNKLLESHRIEQWFTCDPLPVEVIRVKRGGRRVLVNGTLPQELLDKLIELFDELLELLTIDELIMMEKGSEMLDTQLQVIQMVVEYAEEQALAEGD